MADQPRVHDRPSDPNRADHSATVTPLCGVPSDPQYAKNFDPHEPKILKQAWDGFPVATSFKTKDSGRRENFTTGSRRDDRTGKGRYDLLPTHAMRRLAQVYERGATKYGDRNWEKGQPLSRYLDSALRHTFQVLEGKTDEDHAGHAAWNLLAFIETQHRIREGVLPESLDDLP
jgi:hypothetical protein